MPLRIDGYTEWRYWGTDQPVSKQTTSFSIALSNGTWLITTVPPDAFVPEVQIGFDRSVMYALMFSPPNSGVGIVRRTEIPHLFEELMATAIWLTYASGHYFRNVTGPTMPPPLTADVASGGPYNFYDPYMIRFAASVSHNTLGVPQEIHWWDDSGLNRLTKQANPAPFDTTPLTNVTFRILAITNVSEYTFPLRSAFEVFVLRARPEQGVHRVSEIILTTTNVSFPETLEGVRPRIPSEITIYEQQFFSQSNKFSFHYNSSRWLTEDEAKRLPAFHQAGADGASQHRTASSRKTVIVWVLVGVTATASFVLFYGRGRIYTTSNIKQEEDNT